MSNGPVPPPDESGDENWNITLFDLNNSVPDQALDVAPSLPGRGMPRHYLDYRPLDGQDIIEFLTRGGVPVGSHDLRTAEWAARNLDLATLLTVLSWVRRASVSGSS